MSAVLSVRLNKSQQEKLAVLYKLYQIKSESDSGRFREVLDKWYSEKTEQSNTPTLSTTQQTKPEELEGWDCIYRVLIHPYNKFSKKKEPMIFCLNPTTRGILKTNELYVQVCKKCHDTKGSTKPLELPEPPEPKKPEPSPEPKPVQKQRECIDCGCNISKLQDWKTRCLSCWRKNQNPKRQDAKPLDESHLSGRERDTQAIQREIDKLNDSRKEGMNIN